MTLATAYLCVLIAALLPYVWVVLAKVRGRRYDNRDPRGWLARQDSPLVQRAHAAHLNAFEAFAPFAAAVVMAQLAGVAPARIAAIALVFVALRVLHGVFYLANQAALRSLAWLGGFVCVLLLMVSAIRHLAA
ncbi:MAG TPA: MAPEG family protein [Lysobacter sp.]|nr:MAPEG family protein [Lysobacter sp.]